MKLQFIKWAIKHLALWIISIPRVMWAGIVSMQNYVLDEMIDSERNGMGAVGWILYIMMIIATSNILAIIYLINTNTPQQLAIDAHQRTLLTIIISAIFVVPTAIQYFYRKFINEINETVRMLKD